MLKINNKEIENKINELNREITAYREIELNLFNQLKDACVNWQDGISLEFENKIFLERKESILLLQDLEEKVDVLRLIHDKYQELGENIKCNLENKQVIIYWIENCENQIESILHEFEKIDENLSWNIEEKVRKQKGKIIDIKNELIEVKKKIEKTYETIENIENEIEGKIKKLEGVKINSFDYHFPQGKE